MTTNFTLNKKMKEKLAYDLTAKAVEKKMKALEKKLRLLNVEFWVEYQSRIDEVLQIDPNAYDRLIQVGALRYTTTVYVHDIPYNGVWVADDFREMMRSLPMSYVSRRDGHARHLTVAFRSEKALPMVNREDLGLASGVECKLAYRADQLLAEYFDIIKSAVKFHADVTQIIMPIRSYRVLLDQFPEAAKLLPAPTKPAGNMIPVELINDVRERLKAGIPA